MGTLLLSHRHRPITDVISNKNLVKTGKNVNIDKEFVSVINVIIYEFGSQS